MTIGHALPRVEGKAKVTGSAKYAADNSPPGVLHAVLVGSPIAAGQVSSIDTAAAQGMSGVVRVLTRTDMPRFGRIGPPAAVLRLPMQSDEIQYEGEPVAIVLAETLEAAEAAGSAVVVRTRAKKPITGHGTGNEKPNSGAPMGGDVTKGNFDEGFAVAARRVDQTYVQPARHHNPMETSATVAVWSGGALTLYDAVQAGPTVPPVVAAALGIQPEDVRVIAPHTGGGFGVKGYIWPHEILAAAAARMVGRPVKLVLTRAQMYAVVGYQPQMWQRVTLGCDAEGRLTAMRHDVINTTAIGDDHLEPSTETTKGLYACPAIATTQRLERVNANLPTALRAPVDGPGAWALESAMDEMARSLKLDPLDLRVANHAATDPMHGKPWSSKKLIEAYEEGARLFGWRERHSRKRQDGPWRIGHGMATCTMGSFRFPGSARVRMRADGTAVVETGTHDIGSGTTTIFTQIAADTLGLDSAQVSIRWGDTRLPATGPVYGSSATMGTGSAVLLAARDVNAKLAELAGRPIAGRDAAAMMVKSGIAEISGDGRFALPNDAPFSADGSGSPYAMRTWGAIFVEIGVDADLGIVRLRRAVGSYSAGRIINPRTACSQMIGGIVWGWGKATMEQSVQEPHRGRWLAKNLSNVAIPVNADIPSDIQIHFVDEIDTNACPLGARGIGELGATGVDAAVANAVFDAVGVRVRELPITPSKLLRPSR